MSQKPTLRQQLIGAAIGTVAALGMYGVYSVTAPMVQGFFASVSAQEEAPSKFTDADRAARREEIAARARKIIEEMTTESAE